MIVNGSEELLRTGRYRTTSEAVREFVRRVWSGDRCAVLTVLVAAEAQWRDCMLDNLDLRFRPQIVGASQQAVFRRVLGGLELTDVRYRGGRITARPRFDGSLLAKRLDRCRGPRPRRALQE